MVKTHLVEAHLVEAQEEGGIITEQAARSGQRRGRGKRAGLDVARILQAARCLDPATLTVQAVADELGVDRKAVSHHVADRDSLLRLVALDTFEASLSALAVGAQSSWQQACRAYAAGFVDSVIALGVLAGHLRLGQPAGSHPTLAVRFLAPTEAIVRKLIEAGFDDETAIRLLALLTNICQGYASDAVAARQGTRPRPANLRSALGQTDSERYENLARIAGSSIDTYDSRQLDLSVDVFLTGAEALLDRLSRDG